MGVSDSVQKYHENTTRTTADKSYFAGKSNNMAQYQTWEEANAELPEGYTVESTLSISTGDNMSEMQAKTAAEEYIEQLKNTHGEDIDSPDGVPASPSLETLRRKVVRIYEVVNAVIVIVVATVLLYITG